MSDISVRSWLERWAAVRLDTPGYAARKADMRTDAEACAHEAQDVGISIAELKAAADGDLEIFLMDRQEQLTDEAVERPILKDEY